MSYQALLSAIKGGSGSGNFGHSGRPGKRGGSAGDYVGGKGLDQVAIDSDGNYVYIIGLDRKGGYTNRRLLTGDDAGDDRWVKTNTLKVPTPEQMAQLNADTKPADTKPADTKPADTKPADTKPADTKPAAIPNTVDELKQTSEGKAYFITGDNTLVDVNSKDFATRSGEHATFVQTTTKPEWFGLTSADQRKLLDAEMDLDEKVSRDIYNNKIYASGVIRVREFKREVNVETAKIDTATLRKLQKLHDDGKFGISNEQNLVWDGAKGGITASYDDFMNAKYVNVKGDSIQLKQLSSTINLLQVLKGLFDG